MLYVRLMGGLGNQMFQYAYGRSVSLRHGLELSLDLSFLKDKTYRKDFTHRDFELNVFKIKSEISIQPTPSSIEKVARRIFGGDKIVLEKKHSFSEELLSVSDENIVVGYFQSENYFRNIRNELLKDFTPQAEISEMSSSLSRKMKGENSISVHVRRGDYVQSEKNLKVHGLCELEYYIQAIEIIKTKVEKPVFYIFSDDMPWVEKNLKISTPTIYVQHNQGLKSYEDLLLMSHCKHNIIANSSFSWLGAWLNQNSEKVVVAPKEWFANKSINSKDVIPNEWIKI